jgi:hypothetical protein
VQHGDHLKSLAPPVPWGQFQHSFSHSLHAWAPLSLLLKGSCSLADPERRARYFSASFLYAWDWLKTFQAPVIDLDPAQLSAEDMRAKYGFAWYDMTIGQRIYRLAFILDTVCRDTAYSNEIVEFLYRSLQFHHRVLATGEFFNAHSNHGLYQALGQLAAAKRFEAVDPSAKAFSELASVRLSDLISAHYTSDNVHKEHSPGYHYMVLGSLIGAQQTDLISQHSLAERIRAMEEALAWMIKPNMNIVPFGDTDPRDMRCGATLADRFKSHTLQSLLSGGAVGVNPGAGIAAYYEAGYAFARLFAPEVQQRPENASYLAQIAAFHSRVHKQADHLSFVWYDKNRDILIDPGRYAYTGRTEPGSALFKQGFWYSDPKRIYCESTHAHNTVEVDGQSFPRAKVKPFGSALVYAGEEEGRAVTHCKATYFRSISHHRHLIMEPGRFLLVLDWLYDRTGRAHDYRQFFHFADKWEVSSEGSAISAHHQGGGVAPLDIRVRSLIADAVVGPVVRGQEKPELLGWLSDKANSLIPTSCFHIHTRTSEPARFATLFVFGRTLEIDQGRTRFNCNMTVGRVAWTDDYGSRCIKIQRPKPAEVTSA